MDGGVLDSIIQILAIYLFMGPIKRYLNRVKKRILNDDAPPYPPGGWVEFHFPRLYAYLHKHDKH